MLKQKLLVLGLMAALSTTAMGFSLDSVVKGAAIADTVCQYAGKKIDEKGLVTIQKNLQSSVKKVNADYADANVLITKAVGLKEEAAAARAHADLMKKGNIDADKLEKMKTIGDDCAKAVEAKLKEADKLSADQKAKIMESLSKYGDAAVGMVGVTGKTILAAGAVVCVAGSNPMNAMKIKDKFEFVTDAASELPGFAKQLIVTGFSYAKLLKRFDIDTTAFVNKLKKAQSSLSKAEK